MLHVPVSFDAQNTQAAYAIGFPSSVANYKSIKNFSRDDITTTKGEISKVTSENDVKKIQHGATLSEGNSGGPLVDENGAVIGINNEGVKNKDYYYAIATEQIISVLDQKKIEYTRYDENSAAPAETESSSVAEPAETAPESQAAVPAVTDTDISQSSADTSASESVTSAAVQKDSSAPETEASESESVPDAVISRTDSKVKPVKRQFTVDVLLAPLGFRVEDDYVLEIARAADVKSSPKSHLDSQDNIFYEAAVINGVTELELEDGDYELCIYPDGHPDNFKRYSWSINKDTTNKDLQLIVTEKVAEGQMMIVLHWEADPKDVEARIEASEAAKPISLTQEQAEAINEQSKSNITVLSKEQAEAINEQNKATVFTEAEAKEREAKALGKGDNVNNLSLEKQGEKSIIKNIELDDITTAVQGGKINDEVAKVIFDTLKETNSQKLFDDVVVINTDSKIVMQTDPVRRGTFFDTRLNLNESFLGGKTVEQIDKELSGTDYTVANSLNEATKHEVFHAKLIANLNQAELEALYEELSEVHIDGISPTAWKDGSECIAETGVLFERGEIERIPQKAKELFNKYIGGIK